MTYPKGSYEQRILGYVEHHEKATMLDLFPVARVDTTRVKDIVKDLVKRQELEEFKQGHFRLGPKAPALEAGAAVERALPDKVLAALAARKRATRNVLASAVGQPPASLTAVLKAMSDAGLIGLDGSAWVLKRKGEARVAKAPPAKAAEPPPKARGRTKYPPAASPMPQPVRSAAPAMVVRPTPAPPTVPPPPVAAFAAVQPAVRIEPLAAKPALEPLGAAAPSRAAPAPAIVRTSEGAWDDGFAFALVERPARAVVLDDLLDLSDLGEEATSRDGWVELRWDAGRGVLAVAPVAERTRHAVRMEGGKVASPHPALLLGKGESLVEWDEETASFLFATPR
jgi:hypothetical protein